MNSHRLLFYQFGDSITRINNAISSLNNGKGVLILDNENRENESDIVFSAEKITVKQIALTIRYGSGIICLCITEHLRKKLNLPMMVKNNTSFYKTGFTVTIEAAKGITTGVSAQDRFTTIKTAININVKPKDLNSPGHVFPLRAVKEGVLKRKGHTEATIDLLKIAKMNPTGILCELTNDNGSMARTKDTILFAKKNHMPVLTVEDIINFRIKYNLFF
ncbi:3,4-dihydroxy-2-butanone-4-phosphate synthase [Enterobacteriaceae endosymbiont of Plateumaris consimilis]|uniref:3,4-dihydroxy-2-butanone-4-phosphate synthase n=1 Tax=Enterobacteriaceae endosymbiont of Plateumaris consimilis TaxID=2675794 RepID=UPI001448DCE1|nr:3,4-dihydroxy-2-butanone-4-phosphate synthase [Enterobacteriaceae endosymbiont of Plateumaris consimilis]QJC28654.1 3,4-dihydroxy-2-butanone-4-phosphate synthase [Enterobacteriaceae endosymbiont of Plateumaris consimilis]